MELGFFFEGGGGGRFLGMELLSHEDIKGLSWLVPGREAGRQVAGFEERFSFQFVVARKSTSRLSNQPGRKPYRFIR